MADFLRDRASHEAAKELRFVQIVATDKALFGLDKEGVVWRSIHFAAWTRVDMRRSSEV
jgi:hypothetical protein